MAPREGRIRSRLASALLRAVCGYGLLVWAYLVLNAIVHPETLGLQLTHFTPWPTEADTAVSCFTASWVAFWLLRVRRIRRSTC